MRTYVAVLLCAAEASASTASDGQPPLYRESFVLLAARNEDEARQKARAHGEGMETDYRNAEGELITWTFRQLVDVAEVPDDRVGDGTELYTRHFRNLAAYTAFEPLLSGEDL
ncbi:DUF4288 domain-containing protein [Streptomyces sp. NRRL S-244]|uniref:DUF4288 domain-containing protein n=1 Tax=Streptomyces sp. NRRL S-244 TaxID=1463897 RepID=UPI0004BFE2AC|nr:DUF4288 domain-containing protein [Streptomyces sp. NRRL S-244]